MPADGLDRHDVIQTPEGKSTNQWADGTIGVPEAIRELCEADEEPMCGTCLDEGRGVWLCEWRDVEGKG
jgi:hypothetical protein